MLFFFELALFILIMVTLAVGEFVSRGLALWVWGVATVASLGGYALSRARLSGPHPNPPPGGEEAGTSALRGTSALGGVKPRDPLQDKWTSTLLYNWRRTNAILILGMVVVAGWYWLSR
jgi:hypothetical protein